MKEDKRKQDHTYHHGEWTKIIWISRVYETFILRAFQRTYRHLSNTKEVGIPQTSIIYFELKYSIDIR